MDVYSKVKGKIPVFNRKPVIPEVNHKVDINGKTITETTKPYDREHILRNIEESRLARENSGFKDFSTTRLQPVVKPQPAPKNLDVEGPVVIIFNLNIPICKLMNIIHIQILVH